MRQARIVVVGGGFAGLWGAMGAARLLRRKGAEGRVAISLVSPDDALVIRPRLYESDLSGVCIPLACLLSPVGIDHRQEAVERIDPDRRKLRLAGRGGELRYDQLLLCTGSEVPLPPGATGVHRLDTYERAMALHEAVGALGDRPNGAFSATVVGAGFTGVEVAAELSGMLRGVARAAGRPPDDATVSLVERERHVAPAFGPSAQAAIEDALRSLGVRILTGTQVAKIGANGATLASGERLASGLTVWAGRPQANSLNRELGIVLDGLGRLPVDSSLATGVDGVWAAGDAAAVNADRRHPAPMSCQHAIPQGRQAGENAAAALLGIAPRRYTQPMYLTCVDLGSAGALLTSGFERNTIIARGRAGKRFKRFINRSFIYPPTGDDPDQLLDLGRHTTPGRAGATMQRAALRSNLVRNILISRWDDRADHYSTAYG
jgi:NADH:ubiquinone reductase (H+-translocating)